MKMVRYNILCMAILGPKNGSGRSILDKVANHTVLGNIGLVGQIRLPGNIVRRYDPRFKLSIINKGSTVNPNLHASDRAL